jgi:ABC-type dipeptide/oligopeptide/nickel transport system permease subunit
MCIISITCLLAVFAYVLAPDNTPYANTMIVELGARPPGFKKQVLLVPKPVQQEQPGWLQAWLSGRPSDYRPLPVNSWTFSGDQLVVAHYIDEGMEDTLSYPLSVLLGQRTLQLPREEQQAYIRQHLIKKQTFWLGTDRYGRDILSRLLVGARVSLAVGLVAVILSLSIGIVLGAVAGYFGGVADNIIMWLINILWAIPTLLLVFAITLAVGKGFWEIFIAIGLTMWVSAARLIRGQVLSIRETEYVTAAKALGVSNLRIIVRHILPNVTGPLMVIAASNFATAILIEAGLSFLGIGVQPPQPSWGLMIKEHYNFLLTDQPLAAIIPGIAIMLLVFAFNILGNALRDVTSHEES